MSEPGTVAYHQAQAAWWRRHRRAYLLPLFLALFANAWSHTLWIDLLSCLIVYWLGASIQQSHSRYKQHLSLAWKIEANETVRAMAQSGMYSLREALEALRDGPMPPGMSRKEWVAGHDEMLAELRRRGEL